MFLFFLTPSVRSGQKPLGPVPGEIRSPQPRARMDGVFCLSGGKMKLAACDVCLAEEKKVTKAPWRFRIKNPRSGLSVSTDVCAKHKDYFKKGATVESVSAVVDKAYLVEM